MKNDLTRRSFLIGSLAAAAGLAGCTTPDRERVTPASPSVSPIRCDALGASSGAGGPLWETAMQAGIVYGSSTATWQLADPEFRRLYRRHAAILFTEDDLLWYRLRPTPTSGLDFTYGDQIVDFAEDQGMLVLGAHLVWDDGFGEGWTDEDLWAIDERRARRLLFGTIDAVVRHYRGRMAGWIVANEVVDGTGRREDVPWHHTIGPSYIEEAFHAVHEVDPDALLLLNDYGFETDDSGTAASDKRAATLALLDELIDADVPVQALGVQAHLLAENFAEAFDVDAYRAFLTEVADRGLAILITEMDVLDDGLPRDVGERDRAVADVYRRYLDPTLDEPAVASLITFGVSDRYTWLQEDYPREDGAARRPLPFDEGLEAKPAYGAVASSMQDTVHRNALWVPPRC